MKNKFLTCLAILVLFISCASSVQVAPMMCQNTSTWSTPQDKRVISVNASERFFLSPWWNHERVIHPEKVFESANIDCRQLVGYSVQIDEDIYSFLGRMVFLPSVTVNLQGNLEETVQRDEDDF